MGHDERSRPKANLHVLTSAGPIAKKSELDDKRSSLRVSSSQIKRIELVYLETEFNSMNHTTSLDC